MEMRTMLTVVRERKNELELKIDTVKTTPGRLVKTENCNLVKNV
jgi:hypothetical protein